MEWTWIIASLLNIKVVIARRILWEYNCMVMWANSRYKVLVNSFNLSTWLIVCIQPHVHKRINLSFHYINICFSLLKQKQEELGPVLKFCRTVYRRICRFNNRKKTNNKKHIALYYFVRVASIGKRFCILTKMLFTAIC